jgi:hypothetical protein
VAHGFQLCRLRAVDKYIVLFLANCGSNLQHVSHTQVKVSGALSPLQLTSRLSSVKIDNSTVRDDGVLVIVALKEISQLLSLKPSYKRLHAGVQGDSVLSSTGRIII